MLGAVRVRRGRIWTRTTNNTAGMPEYCGRLAERRQRGIGGGQDTHDKAELRDTAKRKEILPGGMGRTSTLVAASFGGEVAGRRTRWAKRNVDVGRRGSTQMHQSTPRDDPRGSKPFLSGEAGVARAASLTTFGLGVSVVARMRATV